MFNNPYNYYPYMNTMGNIPMNMTTNSMMRPRGGLLRSLSSIKWSDVLNNTQKTLNVINQAIPVYYQIKPIFNNVKSFGRLVSAFNSDDEPSNSLNRDNDNTTNEKKVDTSNNGPTFFIN